MDLHHDSSGEAQTDSHADPDFGPQADLRDPDLDGDTLREECGVFGCIASGVWPTELDVPHVITLGLVGLQHR